MNFWGEKVYVGRRVVREKDGVVYQGDILCTFVNDNVVENLLEFGYYNYLPIENNHLALFGEIYVSCLTEIPAKENIWLRNTLLKRAVELNTRWTSINVPASQRIKKR